MDSVFCIVQKSNRRLFEVCGSYDVAVEHLSSYSVLRAAGIEILIVERVVWK